MVNLLLSTSKLYPMKLYLCSVLFFISITVFAQQPATSSEAIKSGIETKTAQLSNSLVKNIPFKSIGPTIMSGRVVDLAVNLKNPTEFYAAYASGGLWHTVNNGTSFEPIMDNAPTQNIGCVSVDFNNGTIWVGTGEINASRSSYAGIGIFKSNDKGKTWQNMGLADSHHISSILINPKNPDEVVVGVLGHLYSPNEERGIFKTIDGGKTWNKTLFVDNETGVVEVSTDPTNFNIIYASTWQKDRKAWNFKGNGNGSGIYKSIDSGNSWTKVSVEGSGFPTGEGVGRIGTAVVNENTVYAIVDNQNHRKEEAKKETSTTKMLRKDDFKVMTSSQFLALDDKMLEEYLRNNGFQEKYKAESVKKMMKDGTINPTDLSKYLEDANTALFETPVIGAEVYKSTDGGKSWKKTHDGFIEDLYYSYGYYFGKIHVSPQNPDKIYIYGVPILKSDNGGKTFESISTNNVHSDHHALWIDPNLNGHLINGNDGGVNITYDDGKNWIKNNTPAVGQFYSINVDNAEPYNVYGGLQDNGVWVGPHNYEENVGWLQNGKYGFEFIMGGDGMQVQVDSRNNKIVYTGFQFGNYYRLNRDEEEPTYIQPKHELGDSPYRFNWQTPILLSPHNQDILYMGTNKLLRSFNQGDDWTAISGDLTQGEKQGNVAYGTLSTISESPLQFGLLYTGSDDGLVYVSNDDGGNWRNISTTFPKDLWVSRVIASTYKKERVYVTLNGYRWDDFKPYVYMSNDFGTTFKNISSNLPIGAVNVIKEDPNNEAILYLGTDNGAYVSLNSGESWNEFNGGLPNVAVHDLIIQKRDKDLVLGTHGRSIYVADISLLESLNNQNTNEVVVANLEKTKASRRWGSKFGAYGEVYEPKTNIQFYSPQNGKATIKIASEEGKVLNEFSKEANKGVNIVEYNLSLSEKGVKELEKSSTKLKKAENETFYLPKGKYKVSVEVNGKTSTSVLEIE